MKIFKLALCATVIGIFSFTSCSDYDRHRLQYVETTGYISLKVTDAPFPHDMVAEANITITKVEARLKATDSAKLSEVNGSPFQVLYEGEMAMNLLELTNGITKSLGEAEAPVGKYDLVRVYVKDANVILTDGRAFDLKVPSGGQSGIKVFIRPELIVSGGLTSELLLDFDVSRSFVATGGSNDVSEIKGFNFKPVIKAVNVSVSGALSGTVSTTLDDISTDLEGAQITVMAADTVNTTTFTDASGQYMVQGLMAGSYRIMAEFDGYQLISVDDVEIVAGNKTIQDFDLIAE
ncbi:MAG: DUF4382 domain-containing protein [Aurantibacter sp.]